MAFTLEDFVGKYTFRHGQGSFGILKDGFQLYIGTGTAGDPPPDGIRVGLAIVDPATRQRVLPVEGNPPVFAYLVDGTLNGSSYWLAGEELPQLLAYQISLFVARLADGGLYKAPTLTMTIGDPQNAGVWGADDESGG